MVIRVTLLHPLLIIFLQQNATEGYFCMSVFWFTYRLSFILFFFFKWCSCFSGLCSSPSCCFCCPRLRCIIWSLLWWVKQIDPGGNLCFIHEALVWLLESVVFWVLVLFWCVSSCGWWWWCSRVLSTWVSTWSTPSLCSPWGCASAGRTDWLVGLASIYTPTHHHTI